MTAAENPRDFESSFSLDPINEFSSKLSSDELVENEIADSSSSSTAFQDSMGSVDKSKIGEKSRTNDNCNEENVNVECQQSSSHSTENFSAESTNKLDEDEWMDIMGSGDFKKKVLKVGLGSDTRPNRGDIVTVSIRYYQNDIVFEEDENLKFIIGDMDVISGLDLAMCLMEKGEKARVKIPSKLAYGKIGRSPHIPPDCPIECEVELKEVVPMDEDLLSVSNRLCLGNDKRTRGNYYYDRGEFLEAIRCYERAAEYLDGAGDCSGSSNEELQEIVDMRLKVYNNTAAAHLKLSAFSAARKSVDSVLAIQPNNVKALFRKGRILAMQGNTDEAVACMKTAASLEPETKIIQVELAKLKLRKKKEEQSQKAMYQRMFPKSEPKKGRSWSKWMKSCLITGGLLAVAAGTMVAYKQHHG